MIISGDETIYCQKCPSSSPITVPPGITTKPTTESDDSDEPDGKNVVKSRLPWWGGLLIAMLILWGVISPFIFTVIGSRKAPAIRSALEASPLASKVFSLIYGKFFENQQGEWMNVSSLSNSISYWLIT